MKLNSVIFADDSESCDIADFCVLLKNSTIHVLEQYVSSCDNIDLNNKVCLSDYITKGNLSDELALINNDNFICFWYYWIIIIIITFITRINISMFIINNFWFYYMCYFI